MMSHITPELDSYISDSQRDLLEQGFHLLEHTRTHVDFNFKDYSFIVFPFAKAYEGFLKQFFLDAGFISRVDYISNHFRVGKVLSPNLVKRLGKRSVYKKICEQTGCELSEQIWSTWKLARNEVFHYFPHNIRSLSLQDAELAINQIIETMESVMSQIPILTLKSKISALQ